MKTITPLLWGLLGLVILATLTSQVYELNASLKDPLWNSHVSLYTFGLHSGHMIDHYRQDCHGALSCAQDSCDLLENSTFNIVGMHFHDCSSRLSFWQAMSKHQSLYANLIILVLEIGLSAVLSNILPYMMVTRYSKARPLLFLWVFTEILRQCLLLFGLLLNGVVAVTVANLSQVQLASLLITNIGLGLLQSWGFVSSWWKALMLWAESRYQEKNKVPLRQMNINLENSYLGITPIVPHPPSEPPPSGHPATQEGERQPLLPSA